jgi:hypothetical protein
MRAAQIADLSGAYGNIRHQIIADKVHHYGLTRLYGTAMVERYNPETKTLHFVTDPEALSPATWPTAVTRSAASTGSSVSPTGRTPPRPSWRSRCTRT